MSLFQVSSRSVSGRCTCFRDDVVAFGLCVCLVCFRYVRGVCRVGLCVFVANVVAVGLCVSCLF